MTEIIQFNIYTTHRSSHRWIVDGDGLVEYQGNRVTPRFVYENFEVNHPMFTLLRAEVCRRINAWVDIERFDI